MVVVSGGSLQLSGASGINVGSLAIDLALSGVTWISNTTSATSALTLSSSSASTYVDTIRTGAIPNTGSLNFIDYTSTGGLTRLASGTIDLTSSNTSTLAGGTLVTLPIDGNLATQTANSLTLGGTTASSIVLGIPPTLSNASGRTTAMTLGTSILTNTAFSGSAALVVNASTNTTAANVTNASGLVKSGSGTFTLTGTNTYTGATVVQAGSLVLDGSLTSPVTLSGGVLSLQSAGTINNNLNLQGSARLLVNLNGTDTTNGQLTVSGDVTLTGDLAIVAAANLPVGTSFTILNKTSAGLVSGAFAGRPDGSVMSVNGNDFVLRYNGGDGNDVTVTTLSKPQLWRHVHFGATANAGAAADTADADGDGIPNLIERACNLDPNKGSTLPVTAVRSGTSLEYVYTRSVASVNAGDLFTVEWSDSLGSTSWSSDGVTQALQSDDGAVQTVKALVPAGASGHRFIRLKVTPAQ